MHTLALEDPELAELFDEFLSASEIYSGALAMEVPRTQGFTMRSYLRPKDPESGIESILESLPRMGAMMGGMTYLAPEHTEVDGVAVSVLRIDELGPMATSMPDNPMLTMFENYAMSFFVHQGLLAIVQGEEVQAGVRQAIGAIENPRALSPHMTSVIERFEAVGVGAYIDINMATMLHKFAKLLEATGDPAKLEVDPDGNAKLTAFFANRGAIWSLEFNADVASMVSMAQRTQR